MDPKRKPKSLHGTENVSCRNELGKPEVAGCINNGRVRNAEAVAVDKDSPSSESADRPADRSGSYYCIHPPTRRLKGSGRYAGGDGRRWYRVEARKEHSRRHLAIEEAGGRQRKGKVR